MTAYVSNETPTGDIDGINTVFTTAYSFLEESTRVYIDSLRKFLGTDYTESGENEITFTVAPSIGETIIIDYSHYDGSDSNTDNTTIRAKLLMQFPQMYDIARNKVALLAAISITKTITEILNEFIETAKKRHTAPYWTSNYYLEGVLLWTAHLMMQSQGRAVNSGVVIRDKMSNEGETEYMRPSMSTFSRAGTTIYGQQWESLEAEAKDNYSPDDMFFYIPGC